MMVILLIKKKLILQNFCLFKRVYLIIFILKAFDQNEAIRRVYFEQFKNFTQDY